MTPSGTYQYIESWEWDSVWTATDGSGDTWIGTGHSPGTTSIMPEKGEVQFTSHETVTPVGDNDGPRLKYSWIFKFKINENGEWITHIDPGATMDDWNIRCVGPKNK